mgnify:CR=1 FL=1
MGIPDGDNDCYVPPAPSDSSAPRSSRCSQASSCPRLVSVDSRWHEYAGNDDRGFIEVSVDGVAWDHLPLPADITTGNDVTLRNNLDEIVRSAYEAGHQQGYELARRKVRSFLDWAES